MSNMKVKCERKWYDHFGIYMQVMQPCCITCCLIVAIWMVVYEIVNISLYQICSISFKDTTDNKTRCSWRNQVTGISLTTLMFLWTPSKILVSLAQSLKLSLRKSSTHKAKASWGLLRTWWRAVTKMFGIAKKRWTGEKGGQIIYHP